MSTSTTHPPRRPPATGLHEQLRLAIVASGLSTYELGKRAGLNPTLLGRFVQGKRDVRLATAARIATALGLRLADAGATGTSVEDQRNVT